MLAAGAASGVAAAFDAPIAGTAFAIEFVLQGTFDRTSLSAILLSTSLSAFLAKVGDTKP